MNSLQSARKWGKEMAAYEMPKAGLRATLKFLYFGLYFRYPLCCIKYFISLMRKGFPPASYVAAHLKSEKEFKVFHKSKHVPCPKCLAKG